MNFLTNTDGPLYKAITKIVYSVWLNLLWFICCLPIFTIGPSTTALFYCCQKLINDEDGYITQSFFKSFKTNFKQATIIGLIMTGLGVIMGIDGFVLFKLHSASVFWTLISAVFIVAALAYTIILVWIFALLARYENTIKYMFANSIMLGMRFLICTATMISVYFLMSLIIIRIFTPAIIFGMGICALINSLLLRNIFVQCENHEPENERNDL